MAHCEHRQDEICVLLRRGGASSEGYTNRCPSPDIPGEWCQLPVTLQRWIHDDIRNMRGEPTQADVRRITAEVLPLVVLDFCEKEL